MGGRTYDASPVDPEVHEELLTPPDDQEIEFFSVTYERGGCSSRNGSFARRPGRQYGLVMAGALEVTIGFEQHRLGPGDSIAFDSTTPHHIANGGDEPARALWIRVCAREERLAYAQEVATLRRDAAGLSGGKRETTKLLRRLGAAPRSPSER
jgi:quercetin dioxygenase-like cupin family protein